MLANLSSPAPKFDNRVAERASINLGDNAFRIDRLHHWRFGEIIAVVFHEIGRPAQSRHHPAENLRRTATGHGLIASRPGSVAIALDATDQNHFGTQRQDDIVEARLTHLIAQEQD